MAFSPKLAFQKLLRSKNVRYQTSGYYTLINQTYITFEPESETVIFRNPAHNQFSFNIPFSTPDKIYRQYQRFTVFLDTFSRQRAAQAVNRIQAQEKDINSIAFGTPTPRHAICQVSNISKTAKRA